MWTFSKRSTLAIIAAVALLLLAVAAPALARGGDYGVNTGASAQSSSTCGGTSGPACTLTINGYGLTYSHTRSDGDHIYTFDDFDCTLIIHTNGYNSGRGSECDQYQPNA